MAEMNLNGISLSIPTHLNEEQAIRHYFKFGFEHNVILKFLSRYHGITISARTLCYRLKEYGLSRRCAPDEINEEGVAHLIRQELNEERGWVPIRIPCYLAAY